MVESKNKIQILLFVSLTILSLEAIEINLLNILTDFKCKTQIITYSHAKWIKVYGGTSLCPMYYRTSNGTSNGTSTVIAYIVDESRFEEIASANALNVRTDIAHDLRQNNHEMIVLGIKHCQNDEFDLISAFIFNIIKLHPYQMSLRIVIMGEQSFNRIYSYRGFPVAQYQENPNICGGALQEHLNTVFPIMEYRSKRSDPSNTKEVRFYEILGRRRSVYPRDISWPVSVENGKYVPAANFESHKSAFNFLKRHSNKSVHLLIVCGKDYIRLTTDDCDNLLLEEITKIAHRMNRKDEILCIMGCFNFDWSEIEIVAQIIMKHSEFRNRSVYKNYHVFTIGVGMFHTFFHNPNENDERCLSPSLNGKVIDFVGKRFRRTTKTKMIDIFDFNASKVTTMGISSINGRYVPQEEFKYYCFSNQYPNVKFAFIVMDETEMHNQIIFSVAQVNRNVKMLKTNNIVVFVIKTNNFQLYDLHIIPEWIEWHRGAVHPNEIAVLGGGSFDTTFKCKSPQYDVTYTLLNVNVTNELKEIRSTFVNTADDKGVIVANINNIETSDFVSWRFPMHTINGFYDPVVMSADEMFYTEGGIKILFLIMKANKLNQMATAFPALEPSLITDFRKKIATHYPVHQWTVFLVGLDNFGEKDFHMFAEFVKIHTNDVRPLREFVHTFDDGNYQAAYEYRDTLPFTTANNTLMTDTFNEFFYTIEIMSNLLNEDISLYE